MPRSLLCVVENPSKESRFHIENPENILRATPSAAGPFWLFGVVFRFLWGLGNCFLIVAAVDAGLKTIEFSVDLDPTLKEWRAATAGPMTAEKQTASESRSLGAPQREASG